MQIQQRYWQAFADLVRDARYIDLCHARTEMIDRGLNMFSAIAASTAIATWAVWKEHAMVWGTIIAASQVLQTIKPFIPYNRRLKGLSSLSPELHALAITAEGDWFKIANGALTEEEIQACYIKLKRKALDLSTKHFPNSTMPQNAKLIGRADKIAQSFLSTHYASDPSSIT